MSFLNKNTIYARQILIKEKGGAASSTWYTQFAWSKRQTASQADRKTDRESQRERKRQRQRDMKRDRDRD